MGGVFWHPSLFSAPVCKKTEPPKPMRHLPELFWSSFLEGEYQEAIEKLPRHGNRVLWEQVHSAQSSRFRGTENVSCLIFCNVMLKFIIEPMTPYGVTTHSGLPRTFPFKD